jgi:hemolysin activation/secretion protein
VNPNFPHHPMMISSSQAGRFTLMALAAALSCSAFGQSVVPPPDAGQVLRDLRAPLQGPAPGSATLTVPPETAPAADNGERFAVRRIQISGATQIDEARLRPLVASLEGTETTLGGLRQAAQRITQYYRERGFIVARAYVPAQQIAEGSVRIEVLESELDAVNFDNRSLVRTDVLAASVQAQQLRGKPVAADAMDRTLLLLSDLPGVGNVGGNLRPGDRVGTSDLLVNADPDKAVEGELSADTYGNRYTGQNRVSGRVTVNSPRGVGDRLDLRATVSDEKLLSGRVAYDTPLNGDGLRAGVALSSTRYELGKEFARLDASGTARTASAYASWPLLRGLDRNVWLAGSLEYRQLRDKVELTGSDTEKNAKVATLEAYGDLTDSFAGGGYNSWRVAGSAGRLEIETPFAVAFDAAGASTAGSYRKLQVNASRLQALPAKFTLAVLGSGQVASKNLDSSEKFVLGGAYGVRAYPQGEGVGDDGWLLNVELRREIAAGVQAVAFYDAGGTRFSHDAYAAGRNHQTLRGYGVGLHG